MTPLVPVCQRWTASGESMQAHMNALHAFFADTINYTHYWTLVDTVLAGSDVSAFVIEQGIAPNIQQATISIKSIQFQGNPTDIIVGVLDPNGTKTAVGDAYSGNESGEVSFISYDDYDGSPIPGLYTNRGLIAEYPDAVLFLLENVTPNHWEDGGHFGKIYIPFNSNDEDLGITGHGIVGGQPRVESSSLEYSWFSSSTDTINIPTLTSYSQLRIGTSAWVAANIASFSNSIGGLLNGTMRYPSYMLETSGPTSDLPANTDQDVHFGVTKYLRMADADRNYLAVNFVPAPVNQAWQHLNYDTNTATKTVFLWDKTVVP